MGSESLAILFPTWSTLFQVTCLGLLAAAVLGPLERLVPAYPQNVWRRKGILVDLTYWFLTPILTRTITAAAVLAIGGTAVLVFGPTSFSPEALIKGSGPVIRQPFWLQAVEVLVISDFVDYWTHRLFHNRPMWRVHAIHHSPEEMNWLSSSRVHPINDLVTRSFQTLPFLIFGFSAESILVIVPLISFYVMFLHSNIRWDFGIFRWVLVSPAYHRWHHASDAAAIDKNFSGIFPIWDLLFGTAFFPKNELPKRYGLNGEVLEESLCAHMMFPFTRSIEKIPPQVPKDR